MTTAKRCFDWASRHSGQMTNLLRELVELESPTSDPAGVHAVASRLAQELEALDLEAQLVPVQGAGPLLLARNRRRAGGAISASQPPVLLFGHLDTVWPRGTLARRPVRIENDRLHGPGSYDMKGGLVVALFTLRALAAMGELPAVEFLATPLEEVGGEVYREQMEALMRASRAVLCFEPAWPGGAVKTARKGSGTVTLRARGRAAHAGADFEKGKNAILALARVALDASTLTDLSRGITVNVGVFRGGVRSNVVPDLAEVEVDFRMQKVEDGRSVDAALKALSSPDPEIPLEIEGGLHYPPLERGPHVIAVYHKAREAAAEIGLDLGEVSTGGAGEAAYAGALGVPTLDGLGPDGDGAHAEHEHVVISSLPQRVAIAAGTIERLVADAPTD